MVYLSWFPGLSFDVSACVSTLGVSTLIPQREEVCIDACYLHSRNWGA